MQSASVMRTFRDLILLLIRFKGMCTDCRSRIVYPCCDEHTKVLASQISAGAISAISAGHATLDRRSMLSSPGLVAKAGAESGMRAIHGGNTRHMPGTAIKPNNIYIRVTLRQTLRAFAANEG